MSADLWLYWKRFLLVFLFLFAFEQWLLPLFFLPLFVLGDPLLVPPVLFPPGL